MLGGNGSFLGYTLNHPSSFGDGKSKETVTQAEVLWCHLQVIPYSSLSPGGSLSGEQILSDPDRYQPIQWVAEGLLTRRASLSGLTSRVFAWLNTPTNPHLKDYKHKVEIKSLEMEPPSKAAAWAGRDQKGVQACRHITNTQTHSSKQLTIPS